MDNRPWEWRGVHSAWRRWLRMLLCDVKTFLGVLPSDLLPNSITQPSTVIVNCDPHMEADSTGWPLIFKQNHSADSILTRTVFIPIFLLSVPFWNALVLCGTSTQTSYKVWLIRSVVNTAVFSLSTWTGDIRRNSSSASLTQGQPTNRLLRCSRGNSGLAAKKGDLEAVSAAHVTIRGK